ncbi:CoA transferase [Microbacterium sp.]|uniref:CoA transferase n=1 Tax=Microbacterium sp. TaxID=51671 RepID=UPI0028126DB4|nr:CoA transferase [Microbacterium sp.]
MTDSSTRGQSGSATSRSSALHQFGANVAQSIGIDADELAALSPVQALPDWRSNLGVGKLAYDSVALASLAVALVGADRSGIRPHDQRVASDAAKVQASFGSEKVLRVDGVAPSIWAPLSGFWKVADGWVRTHGNYPHHAERLARLLGVPATADRSSVERAMLGWSRFELERRSAEAGALAVAVRSSSEWEAHPQHAALRESPVVRLESVSGAGPRAWSGRGDRPLSGIRVLDLTRVIAGPVATRDLAIAGADVLRIDSPWLPEAAWQHLDTGQEKRSALLDLADAADLERLHALLDDADVLVHGYRPNALSQFGLDAQTLHEEYPGIVVAQLSAWGVQGPWGDRRGFDSLAQAATGIAMIESPDDGATPGALPVQALDHSAGHFLSAAIVTALRAQRTSGGSYAINISLARIADELLAAGRSHGAPEARETPELLTTQVSIRPVTGNGPTAVTCAPPALAFPGAPSEYPSPVHVWGSDQPRWVVE